MSSPEDPQPFVDAGAIFRQESERQRTAVTAELDGINSRKTSIKPSITPRDRTAMPLAELVKAELGLTKPEDIIIERMQGIRKLVRGLQQAHIDPEDPEKMDPLYQKIETALSPEDARLVKNKLFLEISKELLFRGYLRDQNDTPKEQTDWENKWDEYFKKDRLALEQARAEAIKENTRDYLSHEIRSIINGVPAEEDRLANLLLDCELTPAELETDPLAQRVFEVYRLQGKDPDQLLTKFNIKVKENIDLYPYEPWLQEWSAFLSAPPVPTRQPSPAYDPFDTTSDLDDINLPPATPNRSPTGPSVVDTGDQNQEIGAVTEADKKRNDAMEILGEILEMKTGLVSDHTNPESIKNVTMEEVFRADPSTRGLAEIVHFRRDDMLTNLSQVLIEAKIGPDIANDELYGFLEGVLSADDYKSVVQKVRYINISVMRYRSRDEYYKQWSDFFDTNPDIRNAAYRQGQQDRAVDNLARQIHELAIDPESYSAYRLSDDLFEMHLTPEDFNNNPLIQRLTVLLQQNSIDPRDMLTDFFSQIDHYLTGQTGLTYRDDLQWLEKWEHNPEFQVWKRQRRTRQSPVASNTSSPPSRSTVNSQPAPESRTQKILNGFSRMIQSGADYLGPVLKSGLEKVKKHGLREGIASSSDYFLGLLLGAGIRWGITSAADPGRIISASVGALEGGYKAFRRANTKYEEKLRLRAASGDVNAQNELDTFNKDISKKENIIRKELVTKRRIAMKRFKSLPNKEKISLIGYTSLGGLLGAVGGVVGHNGVDMFMENSPAMIESTIQFAKEAIDSFVDQNFVLHGTVRDK